LRKWKKVLSVRQIKKTNRAKTDAAEKEELFS
jgi:hypothetical protein